MPEPPAPPDRPGTQVPPAELPGLTSMFTLLVGVVIVASLYLAREVLIPITLAVLLSFLLAPLVNLLHRCPARPGAPGDHRRGPRRSA